MASYMTKQGKEQRPRKGIKEGLRATQDKLLDISGPLTQILVLMTSCPRAQGSPLNPVLVCSWAQRCVCLIGSANIVF